VGFSDSRPPGEVEVDARHLLKHKAAAALIRERPGAATLNDVQTITGRQWSDLLAEKLEDMRLGS
jgi:hypothetical protein